MRFEVLLTNDALSDLEQLHDYIREHDSPQSAAHILDLLEKSFESLATMPERGAYPKELASLGIRDYRQIYCKPYRLIYRTVEQRVYVYLIADGRRDMQTLLYNRIISA